MVKFKARTKNSQLIIRVRLPFGCQIREEELTLFFRPQSRFLQIKRTGRRTLEYLGPMCTSLTERLDEPISKHDFFLILEQIVDAGKRIKRNRLTTDHVCWNPGSMFFQENTKALYLIYKPFNEENDYEILDAIRFLINNAKPSSDEKDNYIAECFRFVERLTTFNAERIEDYIRLKDIKAVLEVCGDDGEEKTNVDEEMTNTDEEQTTADEDLTEEDSDLTIGADDYIDEMPDGFDEDDMTSAEDCPSLLRIKTEEEIPINNVFFTIGRSPDISGYRISDNKTVSRDHASITTRNRNDEKKYYLEDRGSTRGSFINGHRIEPHKELELHDGDRICFGTEEFVFNI